jgi:hypothetical protein
VKLRAHACIRCVLIPQLDIQDDRLGHIAASCQERIDALNALLGGSVVIASRKPTARDQLIQTNVGSVILE